MYTFGAKNPTAVVSGMIRSHCIDLDFPSAKPIKYFKIIGYQKKTPIFTKIDDTSNVDTLNIANKNNDAEILPEEILQNAYDAHISTVKTVLMDAILENDPVFFEHSIVKLLIEMGYGYDKNSSIVVGGSHDGGIDGIIFEDKLGLDLIYLQAKKYKADNTVGRKELQAFVGAMQNVHKGVFVTTSSFTKEAEKYVELQQQKSLKLIDGFMLADLMVKYKIGIIQVGQPMIVYKLDQSFFENNQI